MTDRVLICTDLDRTLLPNGAEPESAGARERFHAVVDRPEVELAFVSGRHRALVEAAIADYQLPRPDFVIGDVGTTLYHVEATLKVDSIKPSSKRYKSTGYIVCMGFFLS